MEAHRARVAALRRLLAARGLAAALIVESHDVRYLSGFRGEDAALLVSVAGADESGAPPDPNEGLALICTDSRYWVQVADEVEDFVLERTERLLDDALAALHRELGSRVALGFQGPHTSYTDWRRLRRLHDGPLRDLGETVLQQRMVKDEQELVLLGEAGALIDRALELVVAEGLAGRTEAEVAWRLDCLLRELGADGTAFDTIVAAGPHAAAAHAIPGDEPIRAGQLVLIDAGARYRGYCSDITRTFAVGEPGPREREVYDVVLAAQLAALAAVRPGVDGRAVDGAARDLIEKAGYGDCFGHGTGHGVGLQVHELPLLGKRRSHHLDVGMVHSVEPGIYLPGRLGVRIEDTVVVTEDGHRRLTCSTKELRTVD